jgi:hypothetical protein
LVEVVALQGFNNDADATAVFELNRVFDNWVEFGRLAIAGRAVICRSFLCKSVANQDIN